MIQNNELKKHLTASAIIINDEGKILLVHHKKLNTWLYPGGHVESNETPDFTVVREVKEETGLDVEIISEKDENLSDIKADVIALHIPYAILCERIRKGDEHYHIDMIYVCRMLNDNMNGIIVNNPKESTKIGFFGLNDLKELNLFPNFRVLLEKVLMANSSCTNPE